MCVSLTSLDARIGQERHDEAGQQRHEQDEDENARLEARLDPERGGLGGDERPGRPGRDQCTRDASDRRQHESFGEQLPLQP